MRKGIAVGSLLFVASFAGCGGDVETVPPSATLHQLQFEVRGPTLGPLEVFLVVDDAPTAEASDLRNRVPSALRATLLPILHPGDWLDRDVSVTVASPSTGTRRELLAPRGASGTYRITELAASVQRAVDDSVAPPDAPYPLTAVARALEGRGPDAQGLLITTRDDESTDARTPDEGAHIAWRSLFASRGACASGEVPMGLRLAAWQPRLWCVGSEDADRLPLSAERPSTWFALHASVARDPWGPRCSVELAIDGGCAQRGLERATTGACRAPALPSCNSEPSGLAGFCARPSSWLAGDELLLFGGAVPRSSELLRVVCDLR